MLSKTTEQTKLRRDPSTDSGHPRPSLYESLTRAQSQWMALRYHAELTHLARLVYCLVLKRLLDLSLATLLIVLCSPLFLVISLAIWLETRGSAIFRQPRVGRGGRVFTIYKFCTMIPDRRQQQLPYQGRDRRKTHKSPDDPRVTRVGRFLRKTSLDELPQLLNILRGEMSFVGPRPELVSIVERYAPWQHERHLVTPGLTGWWQIQGRSDKLMHEHTDMDIYYVINQSFWLDCQIVMRTFWILLHRNGAFLWLPFAAATAHALSGRWLL